ncbi:MAG: CRISPR-associated endonuclease Cas3'' [Lentisphaerae bacterium]|jgi:CRISPR-associated endonuclease/helicase Cas3|nr:CRISPR-associated endonuclease Cas3'' [Lentisphaerota bacterium]
MSCLDSVENNDEDSSARDNNGEILYAHSLENTPIQQWQTLDQHALNVGSITREFADDFRSGLWGEILGRLHDVGKARLSFLAYLKRCNGIEDGRDVGTDHSHSGAGACYVTYNLPEIKMFAPIFAYCIAGHHAGLPDWQGGDKPNGALKIRLEREKKVLDEQTVPEHAEDILSGLSLDGLNVPWRFKLEDVSFWIRMLFSCLVDADFLDTESFMNPERANERTGFKSLSGLAEGFFAKINEKEQVAEKTPVNRIRKDIREMCESAADKPQGIFSLAVPTGGGKTLSGTAFALRHALKHDLKRIIYVIPYTSIIEQTAAVLRGMFGDENVIEHHSNISDDNDTLRVQLASENWDAPVIVTTSVQFFESMYASSSSRCRKLHNLAKSVIILDEVQLLPMHLIEPCSEAIKQLSKNYGATVVLSTATQLDLPGIDHAEPIVPAEANLYEELKRVDYDLPKSLTERRSWEEIAEELMQFKQVLCIVNSRKDCRELHGLMPAGTIHLSASMCGSHRSKVVAAIKQSLANDEPIRVISTQLVEAGVDIDFPVVYRAFTGLASIVQAAGRCNREGKRPEHGKVVVFMPSKASMIGTLRKAEDAMASALAANPQIDLDNQESHKEFMQQFLYAHNSNGKEILDDLKKNAGSLQINFREASNKFKMIDEQDSATVLVRYGDADDILKSLRYGGPNRNIMRKLQRFAVTIHRRLLAELMQKGFVEEMHPGIYVQTDQRFYDPSLGLYGDVVIGPENMVIS